MPRRGSSTAAQAMGEEPAAAQASTLGPHQAGWPSGVCQAQPARASQSACPWLSQQVEKAAEHQPAVLQPAWG